MDYTEHLQIRCSLQKSPADTDSCCPEPSPKPVIHLSIREDSEETPDLQSFERRKETTYESIYV